MPKPVIVKTLAPTEDWVVASLVVEAARDGSDATPAIQSGIDAVAREGGGVVFLPAGQYKLLGRLTLKEGVTLRGDWRSPEACDSTQGTVLMPVSDKGNAEAEAFITLERGSGLREITIWYPDQNPSQIVPYPWTLRTSKAVSGDNYTVMNVTLVNPYQGICVGPEWNELHTLRNVFGAPLKKGIFVDTTTDIGRIVSVDFQSKWWEESGFPHAPKDAPSREALRAFLLREGVGVDMGRSDWEYLYGIRVRGYNTGLVFRKGVQGETNAVMFGCELTESGTALRLEELNGVGLAATGCLFSGSQAALQAPASFKTVAQFNTCRFEGPAPSTVLLEGEGTLTFQNCTFDSWTEAGIRAEAGGVSIMGCEFLQEGLSIALEKPVRMARVLGNQFQGEAVVKDESQGDILISNDPLKFARPDCSMPPTPPSPRPATDGLFVVTDFGASSDQLDNTQSFQSALDAAGKAGGGTVYVPAGLYGFSGELVVRSGVEFRGVFDVPHHTASGGSVLMPRAGRGQENGTPFIRLEPGSGARGLTVWYPEQDLLNIVPYPWTIQSAGPKCWVKDVTIGNGYQCVDFWTYPSAGHVIQYLAGAPLKRGLFVSQSDSDGWVEDVQFNPHYSVRLHPKLPHPEYAGDPGGQVIEYQREHLEGIVFGRCQRELVLRTFLYAAFDGIAFRNHEGGANARVIEHGTDTGSRAAVIEASGKQGIQFINGQLVPLSKFERGAIIVADSFKGSVSFYNSQMWAGSVSGILAGKGKVLIQQLNTLTGPITVKSGRCRVENVCFSKDMRTHFFIEKDCEEAKIIGCVGKRKIEIDNRAGRRTSMVGNLGSNE